MLAEGLFRGTKAGRSISFNLLQGRRIEVLKIRESAPYQALDLA
jgi:hypothetical protein